MVAIDFESRQRALSGGVNGQFVLIVSVLPNVMVAPDQAQVKRDDRAAVGISEGKPQCAKAAVGTVGDHLRRGRGPTRQNQHE